MTTSALSFSSLRRAVRITIEQKKNKKTTSALLSSSLRGVMRIEAEQNEEQKGDNKCIVVFFI